MAKKHRDLEWKDNAYGANNRNNTIADDVANKCEQSNADDELNGAKPANDLADAIADKIISNDRIEAQSASALSLIPQTMMKRNVSSDGIIR